MKIDVVLDTDTYNEVDDQFALVYAILSEEINLLAVYAAPFHNEKSSGPEDGMIKSYNEICRLLELLNIKNDGFAFKGARRFLEDNPCDNDAVRDLIKKAKEHSTDNPLYIAAIGAPTNVASAILLAPEIIQNIKVVWLGGNEISYPYAREFNLKQDFYASKTLFDSGVSLVQIPCQKVASLLSVGVPELKACMGNSTIAMALIDLVNKEVSGNLSETRVIWDIAVIAYLINKDWVPTNWVHSPILHDTFLYSVDKRRHLIEIVYKLKRNEIFADLYKKISLI